MEPDFDQIISRTIRQAEQHPVSWNKQAVWRNVQSETGSGRRFHFFYYAAAAMIMLLIYFAVEPVANEMKPQVTEVNIDPELKPAEPKAPVIREEKLDQASPITFQNQTSTAILPATKTKESVEDMFRPAQSEIQSIGATPEPLAEIQISADDLLLPEAVTAPKQKIRPIVGIITESYAETAANVKRKKRLRKLQPSDRTPWENPENTLVFAMRK